MRLVEVSSSGVIPSFWMEITGSWRSQTALALKAAVEQAGVDPKDADAVRGVWEKLVADGQARYEALRQEAAEDQRAYQERAAKRNAEIDSLLYSLPIKKV